MSELEALREVYIIISAFCFLVVLFILFTILSRRNEKKLDTSKVFLYHAILLIILELTDIITWRLYKEIEYAKLYEIVSVINALIFCLVEITNYTLFLKILGSKNRMPHYIAYVAYDICAFVMVFPCTRNYFINYSNASWQMGKYYFFYIGIFLLINLGIIYWIIKRRKAVGNMNAFGLFVMIVIQIIQATGTCKEAFSHASITICMCTLLLYLIYYQNAEINLHKKELELERSKDLMIESQIKPHFIFNVLTSISNLCVKDPYEAREGINEFASYLRENMEMLDEDNLIFFNKELENIKHYLNIEKMRFQDKLNIVYNIECDSFMIPPLTIQPLVENVVKHGIFEKIKGGTVTISSKEEDDNYVIIIKDDGVGFDTSIIDEIDKTHIGIKNSLKRLKNEVNASIDFNSIINKGTTITITIPKII